MATVSALTFTITIGASFSSQITWKDSLGALVPLPSGTICEAHVRPYLFSQDLLIRFSTTPGPADGLITLTDPGVTQLSLSPAQTALLTPLTDAVIDLKYTFPDGRVVMKLDAGTGLVTIQGVVTHG